MVAISSFRGREDLIGSAALWACVTPERLEKTGMLMDAVCRGWPQARAVSGEPPDDGEPFIVWGQMLLAEKIVPAARAAGRPWWHIDNGYVGSAGGRSSGFYRITYRGLTPADLPSPPAPRAGLPVPGLRPWRKEGRHILVAVPGPNYGRIVGQDMGPWTASIVDRLRALTDRPIRVRQKGGHTPIETDLLDCWALVTHSSNAAVDAVIRGIPAFVEPTNPAAPVANLALSDIEAPATFERVRWLHSLLAQQFTVPEIAAGVAYRNLIAVRDQYGLRSDPLN